MAFVFSFFQISAAIAAPCPALQNGERRGRPPKRLRLTKILSAATLATAVFARGILSACAAFSRN